MGWFHPDRPGHEGFLVALVPDGSGGHRELGYRSSDEERRPVDLVQVGCECGWRSARMQAPDGTEYAPYIVHAPEAFEEACKKLWTHHAAQHFDRPEAIRCWATIRIGVDVLGEEPTPESVRDAVMCTIELDGLDPAHITWGVESSDGGGESGPRCDADGCGHDVAVTYQDEQLCREHARAAGAASCECCERVFDSEVEGVASVGPDCLDFCGTCWAAERAAAPGGAA